MKVPMTLFVFALFPLPLPAQHYLTAGVGLTTMLCGSEDLDRFAETYNLVNGTNLGQLLKGFDTGEGIRLEAGYRHLGRLSMAALAGLQNYNSKDAAQYGNGEVRNLELKIKNMLHQRQIHYLGGPQSGQDCGGHQSFSG